MHFVGRWRRELRRKLKRSVWGNIGFVTSVLALGRWPEWVQDMLVALHERAYFEWADTRDFTLRCFVCTSPFESAPEVDGVGTLFCSIECREKFHESVRRHRPVMPSPVREHTDLMKTILHIDKNGDVS